MERQDCWLGYILCLLYDLPRGSPPHTTQHLGKYTDPALAYRLISIPDNVLSTKKDQIKSYNIQVAIEYGVANETSCD